jgi:GDPmannose 4,6-dehydratase
MPRAFITGITGQDGSYLAEFLLEKGYEVHGLVRPSRNLETSWLAPLLQNRGLILHTGDLTDAKSLSRILSEAAPEEVYHLAGQSHVGASFELVESTCETAGMGALHIMEMARNLSSRPRLFHASSSEVFGRPETIPQDEQTPFRPVTPYGCAKAFATQLASVFHQNFGLFVSNGILYNHESPRRGDAFVTKKICLAAAAIKEGRQKELMLGSLTAQRDWGDARDYVQGMWLALQHEKPEDFVFATGKLHTVGDVVECAFKAVDLDWQDYVKQDPRFMRANEPARLLGNSAKARRILNWQPTTPFSQLITEMTQAALGQQK